MYAGDTMTIVHLQMNNIKCEALAFIYILTYVVLCDQHPVPDPAYSAHGAV